MKKSSVYWGIGVGFLAVVSLTIFLSVAHTVADDTSNCIDQCQTEYARCKKACIDAFPNGSPETYCIPNCYDIAKHCEDSCKVTGGN